MEGATAEIDREVDIEEQAELDRPGERRPARGSRLKRERRARTGRVAIALAVLAVAGAGVVVARDGLDRAETDAASMTAERTGAADARDEVEARELATLLTQQEIDGLRAASGDAREEQRQRLLELGLTEFTVDRFLARVRGNAELVEWQRDGVTGDVDRQAGEIPELERCLVAARQAINQAFNRSIDPSVVVATPSEVCLALLRPPGAASGRLGRLAVRLVGVLVVGTCVVVAATTVRDRSELEVASHGAAHRAAVDLQALQDGLSRIARLELQIDAAESARQRDELAIVHTITALDELQTLQDRIELAEFELERAREVSAVQEGHLRILRACVRSLDEVRGHLVAGDASGATAWLAEGRSSCQQAEALAEGVSAAHPFDFPDPSIMRVDSSYYAFATNGPAGTIQVVESSDLAGWEVRGSALSGVPAWARPGFTWAPSAVRTFGAGFVLFYTVRDRASGKQCISRATSDSPVGPYLDLSTAPLVCQTGEAGSIDPSPYVDPAGNLYLTWKSEGETAGGGAKLWMAPLSPDGTRLAWFPTLLLTVDQPWEGRTIEGPSMGIAGGTWVLLYSGNRWDSGDYATGYATCDSPKGPCRKPPDNVVLRSDGQRQGPGGAELFRTAGGQLKVAYAAWDAGEVGIPNPRRLHLGTVSMTPLGLRVT